ncbi:MAG TPA: guanylate kinase [Mycobacteriales bacterium]
MNARLTVLSGPSGVGKGTVVEAVRRGYPDVWVSVSVTTRRPRPGETDGVEYHFVDRARFLRMVADGELLEWAEYAGNLYGTPRTPVQEELASGRPALLEIDLQGARQVRVQMPEAWLVFLAPPSWEELERRLVGRGTEPTEVIGRRLAQAKVELGAESEFDAVVVNDDVERAASELVQLIRSPYPNRDEV